MKKRIIWIIALALVLAYGLLSWVQYQYYSRVLELRTESIRSQLKEAMGEVAEELQVRELIRYLNRGLDRDHDLFTDKEFLPTMSQSLIYGHGRSSIHSSCVMP